FLKEFVIKVSHFLKFEFLSALKGFLPEKTLNFGKKGIKLDDFMWKVFDISREIVYHMKIMRHFCWGKVSLRAF
ncbi:MAG: hypothetical protein Q4D17_09135, partial [Planctomycetia bacterium]|nr:hypothetical protein [Planctomycetia bacterium]